MVKSITEIIALFIVSLMIGGCSQLLSKRTFVKEMEAGETEVFRPTHDFPLTAGDSGKTRMTRAEVLERTPANYREREENMHDTALGAELQQLEAGLSTYEYERYQEFKDKMPSVSERIYFLRLNSVRDREDYLYSKGLYEFSPTHVREIKAAIRGRDLVVGMSKDDVLRSWGRPNRVDVAGDPRYENERWTFYQRGQLRQVFFESGLVQGWEIDN